MYRRDLRRHHRLKEPQERDLQKVEKEMMIVVILWIENGQRKPIETSAATSLCEKFSHKS